MKFMRSAFVVLALAPAALFGANKEMVQLQRDVALLQDDVRTLQRSLDEKMSALRTLVEQTLAAAAKSGTSVAVLESGIRDRMLEQQKTLTGPVVTMGTKIDQMATDFQTLRESISDLTERMNKMQTQLVDLNNTVKVMSAPPAPPPTGSPTGLPSGPAADGARQLHLRECLQRQCTRAPCGIAAAGTSISPCRVSGSTCGTTTTRNWPRTRSSTSARFTTIRTSSRPPSRHSMRYLKNIRRTTKQRMPLT